MNSGGSAVFQSLLHDSLLATAHVESCALFRKKDGSVKAASAGYQVCYGAWHKFVGMLVELLEPLRQCLNQEYCLIW